MSRLNDFATRIQAVAARPRVRTGALIAAVTVACLAIWFLRRPGQLEHPYVWAEEYRIINRWIAHGFWGATFSQYQGYLLVPASAIIAGSASLNIWRLPAIEYWLTTLVFVATILLLLIPKSRLPLKWRCGIAFLLVLAPMNPEVFGVALYAYWWTALWPLIALFWERNVWWLRIPVLVVGGLSGFAGAVNVALYGLAFLVRRKRSDLVSTGVLAVFFGLQLWAYSHSRRGDAQAIRPRSIVIQFFRNFGSYDFGWMHDATVGFLTFFGICVVGFLATVLVRYIVVTKGAYRNEVLLLGAALGLFGLLGSSVASLATHPITAGPRYFFYPFVLAAWKLFVLVMVSEVVAERVIALVLLSVSVLTLSQGFSRFQISRSWSDELARCESATSGFPVAVFSDGTYRLVTNAVHVPVKLCRSFGYPNAGRP